MNKKNNIKNQRLTEGNPIFAFCKNGFTPIITSVFCVFFLVATSSAIAHTLQPTGTSPLNQSVVNHPDSPQPSAPDKMSREPSNTSGSTSASEKLYQQFLSITGLVQGEYEATNESAVCQQGELQLVNIGRSLTLMLGAHALVLGIQQPAGSSATYTDRNCHSKVTAKFGSKNGKGYVEGRRTEKCKGSTTTVYNVTATFSDSNLHYTRTVTQGERITRQENCTLHKVDD